MHTKEYIQATFEVLEKGADITKTLHALRTSLQAHGLQKLYPRILKGLCEKIERRDEASTPKMTVARKEDVKQFEQELTAHVHHSKYKPDVRIDAQIIGGYVLETQNVRIDQSYKTKLLHTYRRIIV